MIVWTFYRLKSSVYKHWLKIIPFIGTVYGHSTSSLFHSGKVEGSHTCQGEGTVSPVNAEPLTVLSSSKLFSASLKVHMRTLCRHMAVLSWYYASSDILSLMWFVYDVVEAHSYVFAWE